MCWGFTCEEVECELLVSPPLPSFSKGAGGGGCRDIMDYLWKSQTTAKSSKRSLAAGTSK